MSEKETSDWREWLKDEGSRMEQRFDDLRRRLKEKLGLTDPVTILPYRGHGTADRLWLKGRVLEQRALKDAAESDTVWENMLRMFERYESDEIAGARLIARYDGQEVHLETDNEGFFELHLHGDGRPRGELAWHDVDLELLEPLYEDQARPQVTGRIVVPPEDADHIVVSDVDDTIVQTGATNLLRHARTVFMNNAYSRTPFPGVAAFYRALQRGRDGGRPKNPIFYVSSSPWNLYDLFAAYLDLHEIPVGPILLKDFGLESDKIFKTGHGEHKVAHVERLMEAYPGIPFILIGDTGQKDAEIYRQVVESHGERVRAVYLRDVSGEERDAQVDEIAGTIRAEGVPVVVADHSIDAARDAVERGWIPAGTIEEIESHERREEERERRGAER